MPRSDCRKALKIYSICPLHLQSTPPYCTTCGTPLLPNYVSNTCQKFLPLSLSPSSAIFYHKQTKCSTEEDKAKKKTCWSSPRVSAEDRIWYSCPLLLLSSLPVLLLGQQGRKRSEECHSKEWGEGNRDTISERETDWGQSRTEQGKPKAGSHNAWWDGGWTLINTDSLFSTISACKRTEAPWRDEKKRKRMAYQPEITTQIQTQHRLCWRICGGAEAWTFWSAFNTLTTDYHRI